MPDSVTCQDAKNRYMPNSVTYQEGDMRYEKVDNLLKLAMQLQASLEGLSLADIEAQFSVGRRTAMRMRDAIVHAFPQTEEVETGDRTKRWRIPSGTLDRLASITANDLSALDLAAKVLSRDNRSVESERIIALILKLKGIIKPDTARRIAPDLEVLLEAEGLATRPGPKSLHNLSVVNEIRQAILSCMKINIHYRNRRTKKVNIRLVHPYGFLHGNRNYLIGWLEDKKARDFTIFALPNIVQIEMTDSTFIRNPNFKIADFASKSFGIFQDEPFKTVWRFSAKAAADAEEYLFHHTQRQERQEDGSLIVTLFAASDLEMAWHLYTWGDQVEVLEPPSLAQMVNPHRMAWPSLP